VKRILVIGIGAGDPDYVTVQAIEALNAVDVFFVMDKGDEKADLVRLRTQICERYITAPSYRVVEIPDPPRDRTTPSYREAVESWHHQRALVYETLIDETLGAGETGAFLAWGDPMLYDSILRILREISARSPAPFEYEVIPGISSIQALAAKHRIPINDIGEPVHITTGRKLVADGLPDGITNTVVMLDGNCSFTSVVGEDVDIYWGAYLGTADEILLCGPLDAGVAAEIQRIHDEARRAKGWIMSTYLLRRGTRDATGSTLS
jgi:precorrin-6A synthase